jgi:hypothetical protein
MDNTVDNVNYLETSEVPGYYEHGSNSGGLSAPADTKTTRRPIAVTHSLPHY